MLKKLTALVLVILLLTGCSFKTESQRLLEKRLNFSVEQRDISHFEDSHGGFHGDGESLVIFTPTEKQAHFTLLNWEKSAVDPKIIPLLFCTTEYNIDDEVLSTVFGYWYFVDRSPAGHSLLNFTFAYFDGEKIWLYEFDS